MERLRYHHSLSERRPPRLLQSIALDFAFFRAPFSASRSPCLRSTNKKSEAHPASSIVYAVKGLVVVSTHPDHRHKSSRQFFKPALLSTTAAETLPKFLPWNPRTTGIQPADSATRRKGSPARSAWETYNLAVCRRPVSPPVWLATRSFQKCLGDPSDFKKSIARQSVCNWVYRFTNSWALSLLFHPPPSSQLQTSGLLC